MAIKDWILIIGVSSLVLERIVRWIFKLIRPEKEIDKIAMDMVKLNQGNHWNSSPLAFFYLYKNALQKNVRFNKDFADYLIYKEQRLNQEIDRSESNFNRNLGIALQLEGILGELKKKDKLPDELNELLKKVLLLTNREREYIQWSFNKEKIKNAINNIFKQNKVDDLLKEKYKNLAEEKNKNN